MSGVSFAGWCTSMSICTTTVERMERGGNCITRLKHKNHFKFNTTPECVDRGYNFNMTAKRMEKGIILNTTAERKNRGDLLLFFFLLYKGGKCNS